VLRGPQGTLYGRNTTGGAISFFTKAPKLGKNEGYLTLGYGTYNTKTAEGALEYTLIPDELGIRVAGTIADGDGWLYNRAQNRKVGSTNSEAARISVRWKPSPDFDFTLKLYGARDNPTAATAFGLGQLGGGVDAAGYSRYIAAANGGSVLGPNEVNANTTGNYFSSTWGGSLTAKINLGPQLSMTSITGYSRGTYHLSPFDCDGGPASLCELTYYSRSSNFNQDLRFSFKSSKFNATAGLYYGVDRNDTHNHLDFFSALYAGNSAANAPSPYPANYFNPPVATPDSVRVLPAFALNPALGATAAGCAPVTVNPNGFLDARSLYAYLTDVAAQNAPFGGANPAYQAACAGVGAPPIAPILGEQYFTISRPSSAIYGDASYELTDKLTLTLGARYTWDKIHYYNAQSYLYQADGKTIGAYVIPYVYPYTGVAPTPLSQGQGANRLTGRVNVSYKFSRDLMVYANYSRGYRSGTYNGLAYQGLNQVYYVQPEKLNAYEGGLKASLFDRRVKIDLAGFYYDYNNQQFDEIIGATAFIRNGNGHIYGGEAQVSAAVTRDLRVDATLGLLRSKYTSNGSNPATIASIIGNPFPNAPETTFSGSFDWDAWRHEDSKLTLHGEASYMGRYYFDPFKDYGQTPCNKASAPGAPAPAGAAITCGNPAYWLVNGRISYETPKWALAIWGKNLTNKYYYTYGLNIHIFEVDYLNRGSPRTFGVEATARF
jgi:iron complex outermembrane receptor protein